MYYPAIWFEAHGSISEDVVPTLNFLVTMPMAMNIMGIVFTSIGLLGLVLVTVYRCWGPSKQKRKILSPDDIFRQEAEEFLTSKGHESIVKDEKTWVKEKNPETTKLCHLDEYNS